METAVLVSAGILLAVLGGIAGVALGRYVWPAIRGENAAALVAAQMEATRLEEECRALRTRGEQLETALATTMNGRAAKGHASAK